jgi:hypothetical protein
MSICACPKPSALTEIPTADCPVDLKQIQKIIVQRHGFVFDSGAGTPTSPSVLADWLALKTATDSTKVVVTPFIGSEPLITPGEAIQEGGGDNSTLNGIAVVTGTNPSEFTCKFRSLSPDQEKAIKSLMCETSLVVYLITQENKIIVKKISTAKKTGFDISALFLSDRMNEGFGKNDMFNFKFSLTAGWSEDLEVITPASGFNPLTDL